MSFTVEYDSQDEPSKNIAKPPEISANSAVAGWSASCRPRARCAP